MALKQPVPGTRQWVTQLRWKAGQAGKMSEPTKRKGRRASIVQSSSGQFPTTADIDKIFGNVKSLLMLSEQLLEMLRERIGEKAAHWQPSSRKASGDPSSGRPHRDGGLESGGG